MAILNWVQPTVNTDGTSYDAATEQAGIEIVIDGSSSVAVPTAAANTFDLTGLAVWPTLKAGAHSVAIDVVTKGGTHSALSNVATFSIVGTPLAPTGLVVV